MSESAFTPAQQDILGQVGTVLGQMLGGLVYMQLRVAALEALLTARRIVTPEEIEAADHHARKRWESGLMIDSLFDRDLYTLLDELRKRISGEEPS